MTQAIFHPSLTLMKAIKLMLSFLWACLYGALIAGFLIAVLTGIQTLSQILEVR